MILTILGIVLALFGTRFLRGHDETGKAAAEAARLARVLPGTSGSPSPGLYRVEGRLLSSQGFSGGATGDLERQWLISRRCTPDCALWMDRTTSEGVQGARLSTRDGHLFAVFAGRTAGCGTARTGSRRQAFALSVDPDQHHIRAVEVNRATFPGCRRNGILGRVDQSAVLRRVWGATLIALDCAAWRCRTPIGDDGPPAPDTPELADARRDGLAACRKSGRPVAQCLCTLRRVLAWTTPSVVGVLMGALDRSQRVDALTAAQVRRDARSCA